MIHNKINIVAALCGIGLFMAAGGFVEAAFVPAAVLVLMSFHRIKG